MFEERKPADKGRRSDGGSVLARHIREDAHVVGTQPNGEPAGAIAILSTPPCGALR
jgi:hypothetical protein